MKKVVLKNISVSYDNKNLVINKCNLAINDGELVSLLGPSGCGKTTILKVISGFIKPSEGNFLVDGDDYTNIPVNKRNLGLVFQNYALFPHMTVYDNIAFGLKMRKMDKKKIIKKIKEVLELVGLSEFSKEYPNNLSGGQKQRVALARALVINPNLLLLDEPLSSLDANLRIQMRIYIKSIQKKLKMTTIFVTHDQEECFAISDRVAILNEGKIEQFDTPEKIYYEPATLFVAKFVGYENCFTLKKNKNLYNTENGLIFLITENVKQTVKCAIRAMDIKPVDKNYNENTIDGKISYINFVGKEYHCFVETCLGQLQFNIQATNKKYCVDDKIKLYLPPEKIRVY